MPARRHRDSVLRRTRPGRGCAAARPRAATFNEEDPHAPLPRDRPRRHDPGAAGGARRNHRLPARHLRASYEWHAHAPLAVEAGVPAAAIEAIRTGAEPRFAAADQALVHRLVSELTETKRLSQATFAEAIARFGEQGVVELGTIVGYYTAIGNALNMFEVPLPAGAPLPFAE